MHKSGSAFIASSNIGRIREFSTADFFTYPIDGAERAAILLHESRHLAGKDEHDAYEFVWKHRKQLGWTAENYRNSAIWINIRRQTRDNVPLLFVCDFNEFGDCTQ